MTTFFLSYARDDDTSVPAGPGLDENVRAMRKLYEDIQADLRANGAPGESFIDDIIAIGERWEPRIERALGQADVYVCLLSPTYLTRPWCGIEWAAACRRETQGERILPILWVPLRKGIDVPADVKARDLVPPTPREAAEAVEVYSQRGLRWIMMRLHERRWQTVYQTLVEIFSARAQELASQPAAAPLDAAGIRALQPAFPPIAATPLGPATTRDAPAALIPVDSSSTVFVPLVGSAADVASPSPPPRYGEWGLTWCAYSGETLGAALTRAAASRQRMPLWASKPDGAEIERLVRQAEAHCAAVVIVDPLTILALGASAAPYRDALQRLDALSFLNLAIVVIWTSPFDEVRRTQVRADALRLRLAALVPDSYFEVTEEGALVPTIENAIQRVEQRITLTRRPARPVPDSPARPPTVRNAGTDQ